MQTKPEKLRILNAFDQDDIKTLTAPTLPVDRNHPSVKALIKNMHHTLGKSKHGIGLAAPQVGVNARIFIISYPDIGIDNLTVINPTILHYVNDIEFMGEGCLSVPNVSVLVPRSKSITVSFTNSEGHHFLSTTLTGFAARIFQHEYDHLQGRLILDLSKEKGLKL